MIGRQLLLPLLSFATMTGAQASATPDASVEDAARAAGAAALEDEAAQLPAKPPGVINLSCPLKRGFARTVDLSTGGAADWRLQGAGLDPYPRAQAVKADALPSVWNIPVGQAKWVQALPAASGKLSSGQYSFKTLFRVLKSPGEMRVMLKGRVLADEKFSVELFEPEPEAGPADHPSQWGANADAPDPAQLKPKDVFAVDLLIGEAVFQGKPSGSKNPRVGPYELRVTVENSAGFPKAVAMIAQLELTQTCLDWGTKAQTKKRVKKNMGR